MAAMRPQSQRGFVRLHWIEIAVLAAYGATAFVYLGLRLLIEPGAHYVGYGADPQIFIWAFAWWPHALLHGQNPFITHAIWAPDGVNLTWTTSVPGLALLFSPLTLLVGPVAAYNVAAILMPCLAAWTAFLLCRRITHAVWPSVVGGYLFGFSSYMLGESEGHPHVTSVFLIPLVALVIVRYLDGGLGGAGLGLRLGPLLALQLLFSTEVSVTLALALAAGLLIGFAAFTQRRRRFVELLGPLAGAYAFAALLTSPFLYYALTGFRSSAFQSPARYDTDPVNFAVPTKLALLSYRWATSIARTFPGNPSEQGAYLGIPVLLIVVLFAWRAPRSEGKTFLLIALGAAVLAALGSQLTVYGHAIVLMPWFYFSKLPILDNVLPERFALYTSLAAALMVALWTARYATGPLRWLLPALAIFALVPNPDAGVWATGFTVPRLFTDAAYRGCIAPNAIVLPLPVSGEGESMLWQESADFRFRLAGGYIAVAPPTSFLQPKQIAFVAKGNSVPANSARTLELYIRAKHVSAVAVDPHFARNWSAALDRLARPQLVGGILLYKVGAKSAPEERC